MKKKDLEKIGRLHPQVLIAGGASYLGTKLAEVLLENGFKVWVLDDFSSGKSEEFKDLCSDKNFRFWTADINKDFPEEVREGSLDFVFHLARLELRSRDKSQPLSTLITNATGTKNLLDLAKEKRARFLLASSVGVSGMRGQEKNVSPVLEAKRFAEALVSEYREEYSLNARVARLAEVYGPSMDLDSSGTLGRLLRELLTGDALTVYGEGLQKEYYVHIDDAVHGLCDSMFSAGESGNWRYIVAPREPVTTLELAYKVRDASAIRIKIKFTSSPQAYQVPVKTIELQGNYPPVWEPEKNLEEGIEETVSAFRQKKAYRDLGDIKRAVNVGEASVEKAEEKKKHKESAQAGGEEKEGKRKGAAKQESSTNVFTDYFALLGNASKSAQKFVSSRGWLFLSALVLLFLVIALPSTQYWLFRNRAASKFLQAEESFTALDLENAVQSAENAKKSTEISQGGVQSLTWAFNFIRAEESARKKIQELRTLRYLAQYVFYAAKAFSPLETALRMDSETVSGANYYAARGDVARARQMLLMAEAEFSSRTMSVKGAEPAEGWDAYINNSKQRLNFLEAFVRSPSATSSASIQTQLEKYGWDVERSL